MILRLIETILIFYCSLSYIGCAIVLWRARNSTEWDIEDKVTKIVAGFFFIVCAPLIVADVIWERLTGKRGIL
jgi:hypothetical protein